MKIDGVSAIAVILIASFAIDRIVTGLLFLLTFIKAWDRALPDPLSVKDAEERAKIERKQKLIYFVMCGLLAVLVSWYGNIRIFFALGFAETPRFFDILATGLVLIAGSDRIAAMLNLGGAGEREKTATKPIEITGRLVLEDLTEKKAVRDAASGSVTTLA